MGSRRRTGGESAQEGLPSPPLSTPPSQTDEHDLMFTLTSQASVQSPLAPKPYPSRTLCSLALLSEGLKFLSSQQLVATIRVLKRERQEGSCREIWTEAGWGRRESQRGTEKEGDKAQGEHHEYVEMQADGGGKETEGGGQKKRFAEKLMKCN